MTRDREVSLQGWQARTEAMNRSGELRVGNFVEDLFGNTGTVTSIAKPPSGSASDSDRGEVQVSLVTGQVEIYPQTCWRSMLRRLRH